MKRMGKSTDRLAWLMPGRRIRSRGIWAPLSTAKIPLSCLACPGSAGWSTKRKPWFEDVKSVKRLKSDLLPNVVVNGFRRGQKFDSHFVLMRKKKSRVTSVCPTGAGPQKSKSLELEEVQHYFYIEVSICPTNKANVLAVVPMMLLFWKPTTRFFNFNFFLFKSLIFDY